MSPAWRPDDTLITRNSKGQIRGAQKVRDVLQKRGVTYGNRIVTSRDQGMAAVKADLKRTGMPRGVQQWQLPVVMGASGETLCFMSEYQPGAKVPSHSHPHALFRVVISGSVKHRGKELKSGDWMFVPPGQRYALQAGSGGCIILYAHWPWPPPWWP